MAALAAHWLTIALLCLANSPLATAAALPVVFAAQLATAWKLLTHTLEPESFTRLTAPRRRPHWHAAIASLTLGTLTAIAAFLYWTLS